MATATGEHSKYFLVHQWIRTALSALLGQVAALAARLGAAASFRLLQEDLDA